MYLFRIQVITRDLDFTWDLFRNGIEDVYLQAENFVRIIKENGHLFESVTIALIKDYKK